MTTSTPAGVDVAGLDTNELLDHLDDLRVRIEAVEAERDALYAARLAAFIEGRSRQPAITQRALAERAGVSEVAVIQALKKARLAG